MASDIFGNYRNHHLRLKIVRSDLSQMTKRIFLVQSLMPLNFFPFLVRVIFRLDDYHYHINQVLTDG